MRDGGGLGTVGITAKFKTGLFDESLNSCDTIPQLLIYAIDIYSGWATASKVNLDLAFATDKLANGGEG